MQRALGALGAVIVSVAAGSSMGCPPPKPRPASAPALAPTPASEASRHADADAGAVASLAEAEPGLVALEDRRAFEASTLEAAAASPDAAVRARAALAAGRIGDERAAVVLSGLLADRAPDVRASAAFAAGILGDPAMSRALVPLLSDPDEKVAARAAWSLGFLEQAEGRDALLGALATAPAARRPALLFALWRFPTPAIVAAAEPYAADPDPATRTAALYALARRPHEAALAGPHTMPRGFRCERRGALRPRARNPRPAGVDRAARRGARGPSPAGGDRLAHGPSRRPREERRRFAAAREGRAGRDALERRESQSRDSGAGAPALLRGGVRPRGFPATLGGGQDGQRAAPTGRPARRRGGDSRAGPAPSR